MSIRSLDEKGIEAAWRAYENSPIDLCEDHDDEQRKCLSIAIRAYLEAMGTAGTVVQEPVAVKAAAFDKIVAARKAQVDAIGAYNARLEVVQAERKRGNWLNVDPEYKASAEAQREFWRVTQDLADAALSAPPREPAQQVDTTKELARKWWNIGQGDSGENFERTWKHFNK